MELKLLADDNILVIDMMEIAIIIYWETSKILLHEQVS